MRADIVPGGIFPDYELTDHTKTRRRLSELQGIDPMILVLSRGGFCPKDHQQHLELAANYPKIRVAYTQIVTISTVYNGYWFWGRPSFEDLRRDLRGVTREIRPDWDLAAPGLREDWEAGDHSMHHPYQQADHTQTVTPMSV